MIGEVRVLTAAASDDLPKGVNDEAGTRNAAAEGERLTTLRDQAEKGSREHRELNQTCVLLASRTREKLVNLPEAGCGLESPRTSPRGP
jgi:hypothetical protein